MLLQGFLPRCTQNCCTCPRPRCSPSHAAGSPTTSPASQPNKNRQDFPSCLVCPWSLACLGKTKSPRRKKQPISNGVCAYGSDWLAVPKPVVVKRLALGYTARLRCGLGRAKLSINKSVHAATASPVALDALRGVIVAARCVVRLARIWAACLSVEFRLESGVALWIPSPRVHRRDERHVSHVTRREDGRGMTKLWVPHIHLPVVERGVYGTVDRLRECVVRRLACRIMQKTPVFSAFSMCVLSLSWLI